METRIKRPHQKHVGASGFARLETWKAGGGLSLSERMN